MTTRSPSGSSNLQPPDTTPHSFEMREEDTAGTDQDGEDRGFGFSHEQPVPIRNKAFAVGDYSPSGSTDKLSFNGVFNGRSASGTTTKVVGQSRCEIEWTATRVDPGSAGMGGAGGMGGEDEIPPLADVPNCNAGQPLDFADGTFGTGWSESARSTCVMSLQEGAAYDPAEGAVTSLYPSIQASTPGGEFSSLQTTFSVLVLQGEEIYWSGADAVRVKFGDGDNGLVDHAMTDSELGLWPSSSTLQAPDPEGEALRFGFMTCVNGTREDSAVDNWIVRLCD